MQKDPAMKVSASSLYRYRQVKREQDVAAFVQFRQQYQNLISEGLISQIKSVYQHGICGSNQHRQTVIVDRLGSIRMNDLNKIVDDDLLIAYINQRMLTLSEQVLAEKQQCVWIFDLNGKCMQLASKKMLTLLQRVIDNCQRYFPEMLHRMIFVNTPMLFDTIWTKIVEHISPKTQDKIIMLADDYDALLEFVDAEKLPQFLGGDLEEEVFLNDGKGAPKQHSQDEDEEDDDDNDNEIDMASLKQALSGLKVGDNKHLDSVSQTPLNTEADDK